jgi:hypothetical protein
MLVHIRYIHSSRSGREIPLHLKHHIVRGAMTHDPQKPRRNRDQQLPTRKGDTIEPATKPERSQGERDRNAPLPEEETYERESEKRTPSDQR